MRADYLSYKRAFGVSLLGLVLQVFFGLSELVYAILSRDHAALTASIFMFVGAFAWLVLVIVYDQARRERVEAMEADALTAGAAASGSVFDSKGDEFRVASRRLAGLYKFFVPAASILLGIALVVAAVLRYRSGIELTDPAHFAPSLHWGWSLGIGLGIAVIGFVFARYAAGMAKQPAWQNLRAGAAFAVGSALLGLTLAIAEFVDAAGPDVLNRWVQVAFPIALGLVGLEIFLNFVLDIYRPRKAGETPRPAFDSRILGFAAAPDRIAQSISEAINYQLGFNVTSGWFYQLLTRRLGLLIAFGVVVSWLLTMAAIVRPHQRATILRFGKPVQENVGPGLHFKAPWPIDSVYVPEYFKSDEKGRRKIADLTATGIRTIQLATSPPATTEPILWTNEHLGEEVYQLVRASGANAGAERMSDVALVSVEMPLQYAVSNVALYDELGAPEFRDDLLKFTAQRELVRYFQTVTLDDVLGAGQIAISSAIRKRIQGAFNALNPDRTTGQPRGAGVEVLYVGIVGVHPPREKDVAANFEKVVEADQRYRARIDAAHTEEIALLTDAAGNVDLARRIVGEIVSLEGMTVDAPTRPGQELKIQQLIASAGGKSARMIAEAKASRWQRHMGDRSRAVRYAGQLASYNAAPALLRASMYFESMRVAMADARIYVTSDQVKDLRIITDLQDKDTSLDMYKQEGGS